jgi:hypothetical protein
MSPAQLSASPLPSHVPVSFPGITVTQGHPAKTSGQPGQQSNLVQGLTDLEGNPIGGEFTPGKFSVYVFKGFTYSPH